MSEKLLLFKQANGLICVDLLGSLKLPVSMITTRPHETFYLRGFNTNLKHFLQ